MHRVNAVRCTVARTTAAFAAALIGMAAAATAWAQDTPSAASAAPYRVIKEVSLGSPDRWDYVVYDAPSHRVYVAHGDRVTVVNGRDGVIVGQIEGLPGGTHGIAISQAAGLGYTDDGEHAQAAAFSLRTLKIVKKLDAGDDADAVAIDPTSGHVFVVDGDPGLLTVIEPRSDSVVATVHVGSKLEYAVAGDNGKLYVNGVEKRVIYRIDTASNQVDATWSIPECEAPHGLAIDTRTRRLFSSCENERLVVVNADSGATVATVPIGRGTDAAAFDPTRRLIFSSNGTDGTVSVIREVGADSFAPAGTVKTMLSGRTMAVDPGSGRLYVAAAELDAAAMPAYRAARAAGRRVRPPLVAGSLRLLFLDPTP
jgi:DNA-binding beta-propeller fold protein YncE